MFKERNGFAKSPEKPIYVLDGQRPEDVARAMIEGCRQKEAFYIFDMDEAHKRIRHFREMMPRVQIFYALKSNDSENMLKLSVALGLGFDCASPGEIIKIRQLNVSPKSIIYAMPSKTPEEMAYARDAGICHTTFDNSYELKKLKQYWPTARLLLRIRVDGESIYKLGEKFGCDFETEAFDLLEEAASLGLQVVGVAFHVGSACSSVDSHVVGLRQARALFDHEARAGRRMNIVDIGGGFMSDKTDRIDQVSKLTNDVLEELFPDPSVQVIAEPGRYICDSSATLYTNIRNVRRTIKNGKPLNMIYINDGIYGNLRFPEPWHTVRKFKRSTERETGKVEEVILFGPTCDSTDKVMQNSVITLPRCTALDWLVFKVMGAYTFTFSTRFSCIEPPFQRPVMSLELWNKVKDCAVFNANDFELNPDLAAPLPTTLPPPPPKSTVCEHPHIPTLC